MQKTSCSNSDNQRNLACFEEVGGSLWIIKSFYRNSETVGQQCRGRTGTLKSDMPVHETVFAYQQLEKAFDLLSIPVY